MVKKEIELGQKIFNKYPNDYYKIIGDYKKISEEIAPRYNTKVTTRYGVNPSWNAIKDTKVTTRI